MNTTAKFVKEITVTDPDTKLPVEIDVFKHEGGSMFAIDASYLDQVFDDDIPIVIPDPMSNAGLSQQVDMLTLTGI